VSQINVEIPEESLLALRMPREEAATELRMAAAAKLYELGKLSSGAAAQLAGIPRTVFLGKLADYQVDTFRLTGEKLARETPLA
jgi:predicted HTH domain antitoxin